MNMLKLFFVIATLATLAKSQIAVEWICDNHRLMGNCSTIPKITVLLQMISDNSDNYEFTDFHYCPFNIVERHTKCMMSYFHSCFLYSSEFVKKIYSVYTPQVESAETLCVKGRPYKKEFREHIACTKALLEAEDDWEERLDDFDVQYGILLEDTSVHEKCAIINDYWKELSTKMRKQCGSKTEKFARTMLSYLWPLSVLKKICSEMSSRGL